MTGRSELRVNCLASPAAARPLRHSLAAFLQVQEIDRELLDDILTAVGEAIANAVEHAYDESMPADIELHASIDKRTLSVDVYDRGRFIERVGREGRGLGLKIVRAIARNVTIDTDGGTRIHMLFDAPTATGGPPAA